jgi:hypothetical protein
VTQFRAVARSRGRPFTLNGSKRMSKKERKNAEVRRETGRSKKRSKVWPVTILAIGIALAVALIFYFPKSEPWKLPAIPRNPETYDSVPGAIHRQGREGLSDCPRIAGFVGANALLLWLLRERSAPEQLGLLYGSPQRRLKDLPRHYAGCVCNVQEGAESRRHQKSDRREVFAGLAL